MDKKEIESRKKKIGGIVEEAEKFLKEAEKLRNDPGSSSAQVIEKMDKAEEKVKEAKELLVELENSMK